MLERNTVRGASLFNQMSQLTSRKSDFRKYRLFLCGNHAFV